MTPPRLAEWLLLASLPPAERDAVAGDLAEEFASHLRTRGARAARRWYRRQFLTSIGPNLARRLRPSVPDRPEGESTMRAFGHDLRFTLRLLVRRPLVTLIALGSLVVGVSLATVVFTLLDAAMLRPLPVRDPDGLVQIVERRPTNTAYNGRSRGPTMAPVRRR